MFRWIVGINSVVEWIDNREKIYIYFIWPSDILHSINPHEIMIFKVHICDLMQNLA